MKNYIDFPHPVSGKTLPPKIFLEHLLQRLHSVDVPAANYISTMNM